MKHKGIGRQKWAFSGGMIPLKSTGIEPGFVSNDKVSILNTSDENAQVKLTIYFTDNEVVGEYEIEVEAERIRKFRVNDLIDPHAIPLGVPYGATIESNVPVVVQFTKQHTGQPALALMSTMAYTEPKDEHL